MHNHTGAHTNLYTPTPTPTLSREQEEGTHQEVSPESPITTNPKMAEDKTWGKNVTPVAGAGERRGTLR